MFPRRFYSRILMAALLAGLVLASVVAAGVSGIARFAPGTDGGSLEVIGGVTVVTLTGTPTRMGRQHGSLLGDRMAETETAFRKTMPHIPGGSIGEWLFRMFVNLRMDAIEKYLTPAELEEMKGMAEAGPDKSRGYRDLLYYHVLQDIGQNFACTGAAVCGRRSELGGPVAGRNFDLNKDGALDGLLTVFFFRPDDGQSYATVAWPGMAGAVSGMNEHGLCVTVFSAKSDETSLTGVPVAFIARRVLANATDVDTAVGMISGMKRMGPNTFLVADTKRAVCVEFDAKRLSVREMRNGVLPVANHFLCGPFCTDKKNVQQARYSDSRQRLDRVEQVLMDFRKVGPEDMASALRDHNGPDSRRFAWGDPAAVNNTKSAHSVIFDTHGRRFWVSSPPMAYGEFAGFRINGRGLCATKPVMASPYPSTEEGMRASESFALYNKAALQEGQGLDDDAVKTCMRALEVDPANYMAALLAGRLCIKQYRYDEAYLAYDSAVCHAPGCSQSMADALAGRGDASRHLGRSREAHADFDSTLQLDCSPGASELATRGLSRI